MLSIIKRLLAILFIPCALITCTYSEDGNERKRGRIYTPPLSNPVSKLNEEQQTAFDALNELQTSTDEMNRLYSTFANINQPCYPADTSYEVSQSELLSFMQQFIARHCQNLPTEKQDQLAKSAVLAQQKYTVLHCADNPSSVNYENGLPMTGKWVMPNVLGRRDIILVWAD